MTLENHFLKIEISLLGAELKSVFDKKSDLEILYEGNQSYWCRSSPVLFPIVGKLRNNSYFIDTVKFELPQHGFARDKEFKCIKKSQNELTFSLSYDQSTLSLYPFKFELQISYILRDKKVVVIYKVINLDSNQIPFSIGGHPGFNCPLFSDETFEDYYLEFEKEETISRHVLNPQNGLFNFETEELLSNSSTLNLAYSLFEKDALVFKQLKSSWINLKSKKSKHYLKFQFNNYPYFGIWTKPNAHFICLEPWHGLADYDIEVSDFYKKEGINLLNINEEFQCSYSFEIFNP